MKKTTFLLFCLSFLAFSQAFAQTTTPSSSSADSLAPLLVYGTPREMEIGGVKVRGNQYTDAASLVTVSGLQIGDKIKVPGPKLTQAMQKLWNLKLFSDVQIFQDRTVGEVIFFEIVVTELPRYMRHSFTGIKKSQHEDLNKVVERHITKSAIYTTAAESALVQGLRNHYIEKGFLDTKVTITTTPDEKSVNAVRLIINIDRMDKVKIRSIAFVGNNQVKSKTLRKKMKETHQRNIMFKKSKLVRKDYEADKIKIEKYYNTIGFRDARVTSDSIWRDAKGRVFVKMNIDEGNRYYFGNISWKGNTIYESKYLNQVLGINKGDVYNQELLQNRISFSQDGRDISSLYLDNGYLFFNVDPTETSVDSDSIDIEMRMFEGPQATIDRVIIKGNDRTNEHVIRRELHTRPGAKFSRADIIRSQREIVNLGYFNQENLGINTPVNAQRGTVDIEYTVEEKPSDQLELSAGYQPATSFSRGGVIGTLGVTFNNFSLRNIPNRETWNPLPQGDGQRFSVRAQTSGDRYQSYNLTFTEPWLGGKKPNSLTVAGFYNRFAQGFPGTDNFSQLAIQQGTIGFGTRLKWPDDNFIFRMDVDIQTLKIQNWQNFQDQRGRNVSNGQYNNWNTTLTLARNSINDPIFPKNGSLISLKLKATPPYSLFRKTPLDYENGNVQDIYRWVEYLKWRVDADWYTPIVGKLTLKTSAKLGILSSWGSKSELSPFERYELGGNGLNNLRFGLNARDIISMRGYESTDLVGNGAGGAAVFQKMTLELRYPVSLNPASTIYVLAFAQGGNAWQRSRDYNPFDIKRSAGLGLRVFLPMFGTLGFDYGIGFDKPRLIESGSRKISDYGTFNIILGFEPD